MKKKIDLHTHSTASDGTLTPGELAALAKEKGLSAVALTDHDTLDGVAVFQEACEALGIEAVTGVEISAKYKTEMHILGLFVSLQDPVFREKLRMLKEARLERNRKVLTLIQRQGMKITEADFFQEGKKLGLEHIGRAHIARALVEKGYASSIQDAFDQYLRKGRCCYAQRHTFSPEESIRMIKEAGGLAVLAHPVYITKEEEELRQLLKQLKSYGLDGVECYYSTYPPSYRDLCLRLSAELGLLPSGGSDFHADNKPDIELGIVCGGDFIDEQILADLKARLKQD